MRVALPLEGFPALARQAASEGHDFLLRAEEEWQAGIDRFDRDGESLLGAYAGGRLIGLAGLNRDPYAADPAIGRLRHVYVDPGWRRQGIAKALIAEALARGRAHFAVIRLRSRNPAAAALYEALGFVRLETVEDATHALLLPRRG